MDAAVSNNKQIANNIDTTVNPLIKLSMYPVQDKNIFNIMLKDHNKIPYPMYEREQDFDAVNSLIKNSILLYSDMIDSVVIYQTTNHIVVGRSNLDYMDHHYLDGQFVHEPFVQKMKDKHGIYEAVGVHPDKLMSPDKTPVVSIGREIINPYTQKDLGFILLNIKVEKLKSLWNYLDFTKNTKFYLMKIRSFIVKMIRKSGRGSQMF